MSRLIIQSECLFKPVVDRDRRKTQREKEILIDSKLIDLNLCRSPLLQIGKYLDLGTETQTL